MDSPNILITNYCNQNCPFCFARREMKSESNQMRAMTLKQFKKIATKVKKHHSFLRLMGGEPLIHPQAKSILTYAAKHFAHIQIFTNGIFSDKLNVLFQKPSSYQLIVNCSTPAYRANPKIKQEIIRHMMNAEGAARAVSITLQKGEDGKQTAKNIMTEMPFIHDFRVGIANPIVGMKDANPFTALGLLGKNLTLLVREIKKDKPTARIVFNCGFIRCMFTNKEYTYVKKHVAMIGWGCLGKQASFDLGTDEKAFFCFPFSDNKIDSQKLSVSKTSGTLFFEHYKRWKCSAYEKCKTCKWHGFTLNKCPGPCLGLRG
ncbi:MAG: radical SAM protein [bacterium]